ncbi:MAX gene-associated protein isoform X2 [Hyla sarda]|uniref:MAX gene-associated protein isoform X2 n=1 Tax=Hyla sarda TaxID=327740 RepID=UPI0024C3AC39|nr:MAX gene-associated protein isoform X2 [Hyla sarda]
MEEESTERGGPEVGSKPSSKAPAFFFILHPSQGDGSKEEGILVANKDVSSVAPFITTGANESKSDFFLSSNCTSGEITVTLDNNNMWNEFYRCNTEMVLTKQGRRMFPYCRYWISGLTPHLKYILVMDITPLDNYRYKWNGKCWEPAGNADPHVLGRVFIHPESPSTGQYWMHQPISFYKLKLTNNILDQDGHIILHSMHRYLPRLHVIPAETVTDVIQLNGPNVHTFTFPQTEFIAVTAYQNFQITQLKIDCNPFAKGFREGTVTGRPAKDLKQKSSDQEVDSSISKSSAEENEDSGSMKKLQELFRMSEYFDGDKENEAVNSEQDFLKLSRSASEFGKISKQTEEVIKRVNEHFYRSSLAAPTEQPIVEVKKEPEDDYDYNKPVTMEGVTVKQEQSDAEVTDDHYNSDVDYPILEKHFAKFKEEPYLDEKYSSGSPTGVTKAKLLKQEPGSMPVLHLEPCAAEKNNLETPDLQMPVLSKTALQDIDVDNSALCRENPSILPSPSVKSHVEDDGCVKGKRRRICKNKIDEIYATLQTALRTSRGPKRKFPSLIPKPSVTPTPGSEGTVAPIAKKRGRPPKPKLAKEALDVHTEKKPTETVSTSFSTETSTELTEEMQKILGLERQLLIHLKTMKYRQVIHPALQQVGIKLNIVDPSMSIDLRYLGVELPLLYITSDTRYDDTGLYGQASGLPFVSRTGKTTDYTKIKGWRDKFSTESATSSQKIKIEGGRSESSVKNLSAFCSDELDEYLENEAKLMGDFKELTQNEPESSISYQLPTKSSSYVRTLDSVLKKQAQQAVSSVSGTEQVPLPRKKRKYTRRVPLPPKSDSKPRSSVQAPLIVKEKSTKPYASIKKEHSPSHFLNTLTSTPISPMEYLSKSQPMLTPLEGEHGGTVQNNIGNSVEDDALRNFHQVQLQSQQIVSKPIGVSKAQMKLIDLEEGAVCEGKPRTYITEERAELSLSTLLTAQASLKNKPIQKLINKRINSCNYDFCRLGCICSSLGSTKHQITHCRHETCMFSSDCQKNTYSEKHGFEVKPSTATDDEAESDFSSMPGYGYTPVKVEPGVESPDEKQIKEHQETSVDGFHDRAMKGKKRKSNEIDDETSDVRTPVGFPIWNRSDVADDPEPLCIPEQAEHPELKIVHKGHVEKVRSLGGSKPGRPSTMAHPEDPVYLYFDNMMTCARVRAYSRKALEEKKVKDQSMCDFDANSKEHDLHSTKAIEQEKEANKDEYIDKRCKSVDSNASTKLIEIISDCNGKEDESKVLNITSQHMTSSEPQSFKLGSFDIELMHENTSEEKSTSSSVCSRVKIAMSAEKQANSTPPKPKPVKWKAENVKPPDKEPEDSCADNQAKSHGGKGLPFYTKVHPAGKLVARLKTSNISEAELVEVNGKNYPQAKLLLGQMGALHPANRLAAYVTRRLQPSLFHLPKVSEVRCKRATKSPSESTAEDKSEDVFTPPQNKTAAQSRPSSRLTHFVMGEVGSMQKSRGVSSSEPTILVSPKQSTHSTRLLFVSSSVAAGKQAPAISTTSTNLASLSTTSLSSAALSAVSAPKVKVTQSLPTLMRVTKIVTKGSSLSLPAGIVVPSTNDTVLPALTPAVVKPLATTGSTSSDSLSSNPGSNKSSGTPISNVIVSPNVTQTGSVSSQVGLNITSPLTVKTVAASSASTTNSSGVTSGKRLGPRLLLIPVNSSSASSSRPVQCLQTSPGQKMVLQPIKRSNGATLFRHPSGQLIQLVPLQVNSANSQQSRQHIVIRNPGSVGVRLPLPTNPKAAATSSISIPASIISRASAPAKLSVVSPPKVILNKSGVTILSQNPPMLSPLGTFALKTSSPTSNSEAPPLTSPKVITFTGSRRGVLASNVMILQSGNVSLANNPPPTAQNDSPVNPATKSDITIMGNMPDALSDPNKQDKELSDPSLSLLPSGSGVEKNDKEPVRERDEQPASEIVSEEKEAEEQESTEEQTESVPQEVNTSTKGKKCQNGQQEQSQLSMDPIDEFLASDVTLLQEAEKKDVQSLLTRKEEGPAEKGDGQQSPANKNTKSQLKNEDSSRVTLVSEYIQEQVAAGVQHRIQAESEEKAEVLLEERSTESQVSALSCDQDSSKGLRADPQIKQTFFDDKEILQNLQSEDESDVDDFVDIESLEDLSENTSEAHLKASATTDSIQENVFNDRKKGCKSGIDEDVDIETVEELSEKINIAHLKASATSDSDNYANHSKERKGSTVPGEDTFSATEDDSTVHVFHRHNHTQNERRRRSELRDLFDELKNALGLHSLPKVSKSYILKQAIKETMNLADTADTLIKKKMMLSQAQTQLIRKVSNLSGKPKEVVLKKLEYLYAKQKAMEAEVQTKNLEDDVAPHKASMNVPLPRIETFLPLKLGEDSNERQSSQTKKPIILTRKPVLLSKEGKQQSGVCTTSNVLLVSPGHQDHRIAGQVAGIPPTLIQATLSPVQVKSGTSMVIQLPSTIELKSIIGNSPVPISLSTVPGNISIETSPGPASEKDDLSMMPKIVNVTSLALGAKSDVASELGLVMPDTERDCQSAVLSQDFGRAESCIRSNASVQDVSYVTADTFAPSTSLPMNKIEDGPTDPAKKRCSLYSSLLENVPQENDGSHTEASIKSKPAGISNAALTKMVEDSGLELELKKLTSAIDEAGLDPSELSDTMGDPEDAEETLTSLLDEIDFLNQHLKDTDDNYGPNFSLSDTASHRGLSKLADGDSSLFSFGHFKEAAEIKEKPAPFSPLFMHLEEGEILDSIKHNEEAGSTVSYGGARKGPPPTDAVGTQSGLLQPPATLLTPQKTDKPVNSCPDVFWRPMPKLAPLGLKSHPIPTDQRALANKSMPSLASVAVRLSSPKTTN